MRNRLDTHPAPKWSVPVTGNDPIHDEIGDAHGGETGHHAVHETHELQKSSQKKCIGNSHLEGQAKALARYVSVDRWKPLRSRSGDLFRRAPLNVPEGRISKLP